MPANLKTQQWLQDWKRSVLIQIPRKNNAKKCSNYSQCTHFTCEQSNAQILQAWLQQYMNLELPDVQAGFRKGRGTRNQIAYIHWTTEKARKFQKKISASASLTILKHLTVWITTNCGKILKRLEYQTTLPVS